MSQNFLKIHQIKLSILQVHNSTKMQPASPVPTINPFIAESTSIHHSNQNPQTRTPQRLRFASKKLNNKLSDGMSFFSLHWLNSILRNKKTKQAEELR